MLRKYWYLSVILLVCHSIPALRAQVACGYAFEYRNDISYTALPASAPTLMLASGAARPSEPDVLSPTDEDFFPDQPIGFSFVFNGFTYNKLGVATNGWIWFGETRPVKAAGLVIPFTNILASQHPIEGIISALNADLEGRWNAEPATISTRLSGTALQRTFTIEWKNFKALDDAEGTGYCGENRNRFDFQIILEEGSNKITIAYNADYCWQGYNQLFQVGLRGREPGDVHARSIPGAQKSWENSRLGLDNATAVIRSSAPVTTPPANARFVFSPAIPTPQAWRGVNTNWFDKANWSGNTIPNRCNDVVIPSGKNYYPEVNGNAPAECGNLLIEPGAMLSIRQEYKSFLTVYGNLKNQGMISNHAASYITLAGGAGKSIEGEGLYLNTDLYITAGSSYHLNSDLALRNLNINQGASLMMGNHVLDVFSLFQQGVLNQGTGTLVIEGGAPAIQMNDSTFQAATGTTFFGNGEVWSDLQNQLVPSLKYHNLWVRTNRNYTVQLGSDKDFDCNNLLFYNPGEPGGQALTARNIRVRGDFRLGIDSLPGTSLAINHTISRNNGQGQFRMGGKDQLNIAYASENEQTAISGFAAPWFRGSVTYSGNNKQTLVKGTYQNLTITGSGKRTINTQVNLKGILRMESGSLVTNDSLTLKSDSSSTALISPQGSGTITGKVEMERFVEGNGNQNILFGTAFQSAILRDYSSDMPILGPDGVQLISNTEPTVWEYRSEVQDADFMTAWYSKSKLQSQLQAGKGLMSRMEGGSVIRTRGLVNTGTIRIALKINSSQSAQAGYNLLSNPYPSPIDWNLLVQQSNAPMSRSVYRMGAGNRFNGQFAAWLPLGNEEGLGINGGTRYIGSQEGFFVRAFRNDTLVLTNQCRAEVLNTRSVTVSEVIPYLRMSLSNAGKADELLVYFSSLNSNYEAVDGKDALKMVPAGDLSYWYSTKDSVKLAIQGRKSAEQNDSIPLGIVVAHSGTYQIRLSEIQHLPATAMVFLEDKLNGSFTNLRQQPAVNLNLEKGDICTRFVLHFRPGVKVSAFREDCQGSNGRITCNNTSGTIWDLTVYNSNDSLVGQKKALSGVWELGQLKADEYRVHFRLNGQTLETDEWVQVAPGNKVNVSVAASETEVMPGQTVVMNASAPEAEAWYWNFGDGMMASGEPVQEHEFENQGSYRVVVTATKGECADTASVLIKVSGTVGMESMPEDATTFLIFPNPASVTAHLRLKNEKTLRNAGLYIIDANGRIAFEKQFNIVEPGEQLSVPVDRLARGAYEVVVTAGTFRSVSRLMVAGK